MTLRRLRHSAETGAISPEPTPGDRRATAAGYAAILLVALVDALVDPAIPGAVTLGLIPPAAAAVCNKRQVTGLAVVATAVSVVLVTWYEATTVTSKCVHVTVIAALGLVALGVTMTRLRREAQLRHARSVAMTLQSAVLEPVPPRLPGLDLASLYMAAEAETLVGGDFYAVVESPHGIRMLIGDVRGKGLPAVNTAAALMAAFREAAYYEKDLVEVAARLESRVHRLAAERTGPPGERFATALLLAFDEPDRLRLITCGHTPPIMLRDGTAAEIELPDIAPPLGLSTLYPGGVRYVEHELPFQAGDTLVATTDGIAEARNEDGEFYPTAARLTGWSRAWPQHIVLHLYSDLRGHTGGPLQDDAAALVLQRPRRNAPSGRRRLPHLI
ncbi:PP2C family protein-serine/threonine phosphatase [Yinghuangia seranimata]|uniref:PP2C family protein-serine/threonine phosphatase n=1 Tax=Yinghuangia seranimata TaxID=408067 RepID=UPI00248B2685|nr:PP2C family protein-serine/threonine phosphatase [Yinghuangia seranimata]MDI2132883.1 PP2C family protein-serine/threonine phosphatase [Yinghuangia seranimata]